MLCSYDGSTIFMWGYFNSSKVSLYHKSFFNLILLLDLQSLIIHAELDKKPLMERFEYRFSETNSYSKKNIDKCYFTKNLWTLKDVNVTTNKFFMVKNNLTPICLLPEK